VAATINGGTDTTSGSNNLIGTQVGFTGGFLSMPPSLGVFSDPGFETPSQGAGAFAYDPTGSPWTFTGQAGLARNGSAFNNPNAPEGSQVALLQGTGSISQTVDLAAGTYVLSLTAAQRPGNQQTFQVLVDNVVVATVTPSGSVFSAYSTEPFTLTAGAHTIEVVGLKPRGGGRTAVLDPISISHPALRAVPAKRRAPPPL